MCIYHGSIRTFIHAEATEKRLGSKSESGDGQQAALTRVLVTVLSPAPIAAGGEWVGVTGGNDCGATYHAMLEVGRAQRTIFVARYLRSRELQREITEGLNVVEAFNGANSILYYGKGGEIASNRAEEQEMTVMCLWILQAALVYVNTLMLQDVLAEDQWTQLLTPEDRRGLTPLFWQHVLPYGEVKFDMTARPSIRTACPADST